MSSIDDLLKTPLYVFDLPSHLLEGLQPKSITSDAHLHEVHAQEQQDSQSRRSLISEDHLALSKAACNLCGLKFENSQEQRSHVRSDLHGYNLKQRMRGGKQVSETEFEQLIGDLDESISGSESSDAESDSEGEEATTKAKSNETVLSALLRKQARLEGQPDPAVSVSLKQKRGSGQAPLIWFTNHMLPSNVSLGIYRAVFTQQEQVNDQALTGAVRERQLGVSRPHVGQKLEDEEEGGVRLPGTADGPHYFLCMIGGGHFAAMVVSLTPKKSKKHGSEQRQAAVLAHKTFHRYTTRRKQGGSQAANDSAKGAAHSAGSSLRRYNEAALTAEVRALLKDWKDMITSSELLFIRATGNTNRRTLFGPYDGQILRQDDSRLRGFPFSTRRPTQSELMRCFIELTRVKVSEVDEAAVQAAQNKATAEAGDKLFEAKPVARAREPERDPEEEAAIFHTSQIEAFVRRSKGPALLSYLTSNSLSPDFLFHPLDSQAHHHAPTPLHLASSLNAPVLVSRLLVKANADPTIQNAQAKTAFEVAGDRATRDAFRLARWELGEARWDWDEAAHVPEGLSKTEVEARAEREKADSGAQEEARRKADLDKIREDEERKGTERKRLLDARREKEKGKGRSLNGGARQTTAEERRQEEARGMTPEMQMRLERERRARAAEERMRKVASGS